jgi:hypothetical protein
MRSETPSKPERTSSHEHYVRAVVAELGFHGITIADVQIVDEPLRRASMELIGPSAHIADGSWPGRVRLEWTERHGWSWRACDGGDGTRGPVCFAVALVPPPEPLVTWLGVALRHPGVDLPRQSRSLGHVDVDAELHSYTAPAA